MDLMIICILPKAQTQSTGVQSACTFVRKRSAVQTGSQGDCAAGKGCRCFFAICLRQKAQRPAPMISCEDFETQLLQFPGAVTCLDFFFSSNILNTDPLQKSQAGGKSGDPGYVGSTCLCPIRQLRWHFMAHRIPSRPSV